MKRLKNNETIEVLGASFNGMKDMIEHARKRIPKGGVYVGEDSQLYPCFDSEDYMHENRYFTNLVFANSLEEIDKKLCILKQVDNYRQILASVQYDVRAILVKLADRLHNMRTLASMRPDKQMKIAGEADYFYAVLSDYFKERPGSVANYINAPKENGYQSFHVKLLNDQGGWEEIHISSERMVRNSRLGCTAERTEENVKAWLKKFKEVLKDVAYHTREMDYMDGVTVSFYNDDIMVLTPQGKGVILPKDATALDFAFEIHSEVGLHAEYARINGRLCSVKTVLHRGDCVEIGIDKNAMPEEEWLKHVLTYKAKRTLRSHFANKEKMPYVRCSCCHPLPGDEVIGFKNAEGNLIDMVTKLALIS